MANTSSTSSNIRNTNRNMSQDKARTGTKKGRPSKKSSNTTASVGTTENQALTPGEGRANATSSSAPQNTGSTTVPSTSDQSANVIQEKDAEIERLKALLAEKENQEPSSEDRIVAIERPKGEAGDKRKGFVLQDAMELSGSEEQEALYKSILRSTRRNIIRVNLDIDMCYRKQDHEKLLQVFRLTRNEFSYLTKKRFPADWAIAEMVKQYLRNQRKENKRKLKTARDSGRTRKRARHHQHIDDLMDENQTGADGESDSSSGSDED